MTRFPDSEDMTRFPENFPDVGLMTFLFVFENKHYQEWVDFTIREMKDATGFFAVWRNYCLRKSK